MLARLHAKKQLATKQNRCYTKQVMFSHFFKQGRKKKNFLLLISIQDGLLIFFYFYNPQDSKFCNFIAIVDFHFNNMTGDLYNTSSNTCSFKVQHQAQDILNGYFMSRIPWAYFRSQLSIHPLCAHVRLRKLAQITSDFIPFCVLAPSFFFHGEWCE